jgi:glycosyltransferase involved in cell wall biosynthesis
MKILQIIPSLASGGAERFVLDLCNELSRQGADVHLCIIQNPEERDFGFYLPELSKKVHFHSLNQPKGFGWKNIDKLNQLIKLVKPDIIHAHLSALLYLYFLKLIKLNYTFFYTIHNLADKACPNFMFRITNYLFFSSRLIRVITISEICDNSYKSFYRLNNAFCIPNGRNKLHPTDLYPSISKEIDCYKKSDKDLVFVHVARYHHQKNQEMLIDVFNRLLNEHHSIVLLIIGDWSFCAEARKLAERVNSGIYILGTKTNVSDYLLLSDAFCLTSIYEGLPISLIEAISCGCIPICTPVGGIPDIVKHSETGYLSENTTSDAYYSVVKSFIVNCHKISKMKLINLFEMKYSIEITAKNHMKVFVDCIN